MTTHYDSYDRQKKILGLLTSLPKNGDFFSRLLMQLQRLVT